MNGKYFFFLSTTALFLLLSGCSKKEKTYTQKQMQHMVDSIVHKQAVILKQQARTDLELRLPIELKPKLDSSLQQNQTVTPPQLDTMGDNTTIPADTN